MAVTRVFISHAGADTREAKAFVDILRSHDIDVWFDKDNLLPGDRWMETLETEIGKSDAMVVYIGRLAVQNWVDREVRLGLELNTRDPKAFKLIPVFGEGADFSKLPPFLSQHQGVAAGEISRLLNVLRNSDESNVAVPAKYWQTHSPFRSLQSFQPDDAWLFFGRDRETGEVVERLQQSNVLIVIGNSGSGKSSLVRAGFIPTLQRGRFSIEGNPVEDWQIGIFRPGNDPLAELIDYLPRQLAPHLDAVERFKLVTHLREHLPQDPYALCNTLAAITTGAATHTLLVVDQFEELFTPTALTRAEPSRERQGVDTASQTANHEAPAYEASGCPTATQPREHDIGAHYIRLLLNAARSQNVRLILALRADFYANCLKYPELNPFLQNSYNVVLMQPMQLREAIEKRVSLTGVKAESGLIDAILSDIGTEPGNLALLEHALAQLWEKDSPTGKLTNETYSRIGRLRGALGEHAKSVFATLAPREQALARRVFLELVHLGEGAQDTRRRVSKDSLLVLGNRDSVDSILALLASKRLIATSGGQSGKDAFVEVSHEALIREWSDLRNWIDNSREDMRFSRRLVSDAESWKKSQDSSELLRGARLQQSEEWLALHQEVHPAVRELVATSREEEKTIAKRELERTHRSARRLRRFSLGITAVALAAVVLAVSAFRQQRIAQSRQLAAQSEELRTRDKPVAFSLAMEGWTIARTAEAHQALADTFVHTPTMLEGHSGRILTAAFSSDGERIVTASSDGTARVWNVQTGAMISRLDHSSSFNGAEFSPDGQRVVTANSDATALIWDTQDGKLRFQLKGHTHVVKVAAFSPDGKRVVTASNDLTARIWNAHDGEQICRVDAGFVTSAAFSPDGQSVVTVGSDHVARVSDSETGTRLTELRGHSSPILAASFSPDSRYIVTASEDNTARVWNARTGAPVAVIRGHSGRVTSAVFSTDGNRIVTASDDNRVRIWTALGGTPIVELKGHAGFGRAIFSPKGNYIATIDTDRTVRVWNAQTGDLLAKLEGHTSSITNAMFSPDGQRIVTASDDKTARVWNIHATVTVIRFEDRVSSINSLDFSPDSLRIVTGGSDGNVRVWNTKAGLLILNFRGHPSDATAVFSPDGTQILTAGSDSARLWNAQSGSPIGTLNGHSNFVSAATFSPDGQLIMTISDRTGRLWNAKTGSLAVSFVTPHLIRTASLSPDSLRVVTTTAPSGVQVWNTKTGSPLMELEEPSSVASAAFSPDGTRIVTAGYRVCVWNAQTGALLNVLESHSDKSRSDFENRMAIFASDGRSIMSVRDNTARVWDTESGALLATIEDRSEYLHIAAFSPEGRRILTASNGSVRVWNARLGTLVATLEDPSNVVHRAAFSPDGQRIVTTSRDGLRIYGIVTLDDLASILTE